MISAYIFISTMCFPFSYNPMPPGVPYDGRTIINLSQTTCVQKARISVSSTPAENEIVYPIEDTEKHDLEVKELKGKIEEMMAMDAILRKQIDEFMAIKPKVAPKKKK